MEKGLIYIFTGDGKGKTSAALGVAVRSALIGEDVCWISWYKQDSWEVAEKSIVQKFPNFEMNFAGLGFLIAEPELVKGEVKFATVGASNKVIDTASKREHKKAASDALTLAESKIKSGKYFLIVLDEVINAVSDKLIDEKDLLRLLNSRGLTHIVLTGRGVSPQIIENADLITECKKIKHPYDLGKLAVKGLDF